MPRLRLPFMFVLALFFGASPLLAASYAVGSCKPHLPSYSTISAAVAAVPAGSTVMVCPGTYPEQVTISTPLTLEGITIGNDSQAVITVPGGGLVLNAATLGGSPMAAQVLVTTGPVNITNITVDGTGNDLAGSAYLTGIYYYSDSSGVLNQATTRYQLDGGLGIGIRAENGNPGSQSVTIENCSVHDFDDVGILTASNQTPPSLTATVRANSVNSFNATAFVYGIQAGVPGSVTGNTVTGPGIDIRGQGLTTLSSTLTVSANVIKNWDVGVADFAASTYTNNTVRYTVFGFYFATAGATVNSNIITQTEFAGIEFVCLSGDASHNTFNDVNIGLDEVPASFSGTNSFYNTITIRNDGCGDARPASSGKASSHKPRSGAQNL